MRVFFMPNTEYPYCSRNTLCLHSLSLLLSGYDKHVCRRRVLAEQLTVGLDGVIATIPGYKQALLYQNVKYINNNNNNKNKQQLQQQQQQQQTLNIKKDT